MISVRDFKIVWKQNILIIDTTLYEKMVNFQQGLLRMDNQFTCRELHKYVEYGLNSLYLGVNFICPLMHVFSTVLVRDPPWKFAMRSISLL